MKTIDNKVTYTLTENEVLVASEYNDKIPALAKKAGGIWNKNDSTWRFDNRDIETVKELYLSIYGEFGGFGAGERVTVRCYLKRDTSGQKSGIYMFGRMIARATGRDSGATKGKGIIFSNCEYNSAGSAKNWETIICSTSDNAYIEIKDVPKLFAEKESKRKDYLEFCSIELLDTSVDTEALLTEKEFIEARLKEINLLLSKK